MKSIGRAMLQALVVHPSKLDPAHLAAWAALCVAHEAWATPLVQPALTLAVGAVREDARVAVMLRAGEPVGFLPHHHRPRGLARPIGAPFSDYQALVTGPAPGFTGPEALAAAGLRGLAANALLDPFGLFPAPLAGEQSHETHLIAPGGDAWLETIRAASPKRFKNWRRLEHKLEREVGPLAFEAEREPEAYAALIDWKRDQLRDSGLHDVLAPEWTRRLMQDLLTSDDGLMLTLRSGGRLVAGHFGLRGGGTFHPWIASADPELASCSPGQAFLAQAIRAMPRLGLDRYDLAGGHDHYKRPFASHQLEVREGRAFAAGGRAPAWSGAMDAAVRGLGQERIALRVRRRFDNIVTSELSLGGRVGGMIGAVAAKVRRPAGREAAPHG